MSIALIRNRIMKCQMQLILYITLAVGLLGISQTDYGTLINQRFVSFLEDTKEFVVQEKERIEQEHKIEQMMQVASNENEVQIVSEAPANVETEIIEKAKPIGAIYIQTGKLNVRETPNGKILGTVSFGETHDYYGEKSGWLKISYGGAEGYVYGIYGDIYDTDGNLIKPADIPEPEPVVVEPVPEVPVVEEPVQPEPVQPEPVQPAPTPQKEPAQMSTSELCQWVLSQIITPDMDDFAKVRAVNQYLCDHMTYDLNYYTTRDAILLGRGRCQGYANAFKNLMNTLGIPTDYVRGYAGGVTDATHAWNRVLIGGTYYYVDVTWNDTTGANSYLLLSEAEFNQGRSVISYNPRSE